MVVGNKNHEINDKKKKLAVDSNIFRNLDFINYLTLYKSDFHVFIPTIVQLEVGYVYIARGILWEDFRRDIQKFNGIFLEWDNNFIPEVIQYAFREKSHLPFKQHFRDFIIGVECKNISASLITYNKKHFTWLKEIHIYNPEEFIQLGESNRDFS